MYSCQLGIHAAYVRAYDMSAKLMKALIVWENVNELCMSSHVRSVGSHVESSYLRRVQLQQLLTSRV